MISNRADVSSIKNNVEDNALYGTLKKEQVIEKRFSLNSIYLSPSFQQASFIGS
jgi:hypothetical protein